MINYFYRNIKDKQLQKLKDFRVGSWIDVTDPTDKELTLLSEKYGLEEGHLRDALDLNEVPRLELEGNVVYIFTRYPIDDEGTIGTAPILFIIAEKFITTVTPRKATLLDNFRTSKKDFFTTQKIKLLLLFISHINTTYNNYFNQITRQVRTFEVKLHKIRNEDIIQFVVFEGILNDFRPVLVRMNSILDGLLKGKDISFYERDQDLVEDIILSNRQLVELADDSQRTIVSVREAHATIMTNNLNRVIKLLTSVTVILTIPTMIASIFGMNVQLPFGEHPWAFAGIIIVMIVITGAILLTFIREDFL